MGTVYDNEIWGVKIEGFGKIHGGVAYEWRFTTARPNQISSTPATAVYLPWLIFSGEGAQGGAGSIRYQVDFQRSRTTIGAFDFSIVNPEGITELFDELARYVHLKTADLQTTINDSALIVDLGSAGTGLGASVVFIGREAILLGTESPPASGNYTGCTRGVYGTEAVEHNAGSQGDDTEAFEHLHVFSGRKVTLFVTDADDDSLLGFDSEIEVWSGQFVDFGHAAGLDALRFRTRGGLALFQGVPLLPEQWVGQITEILFPPHNPTSSVSVYVEAVDPHGQDARPLPMGLPSSPSVGDEITVRWSGSVFPLVLDMYDGDANLQRWRLDHRRPLFGTKPMSNEKVSSREGLDDFCYEVFVANPHAPSNSATPGDDTLPLGGDYGDCLTTWLQIATGTRGGGNGNYDPAVSFGIGLLASQIDTSDIEQLRGRLGSAARVRLFGVGFEGEDDALEHLEKTLLHPFGLAYGQSSTGLLTIVGLFDSAPPGTTPEAITATEILHDERVAETGGTHREIGAVDFKYASPPGVKKGRKVKLNSEDHRQRHIGRARAYKVDGGAIDDPSQAYSLAEQHLQRWRRRIPETRFATDFEVQLQPGALISLTYTGVIGSANDGTGDPAEGVTAQTAAITGRQIQPVKGRSAYTALRVGMLLDTARRIAPGLVVVSWSDPDLTVEQNIASPAEGGLYASDLAAFDDGDVVDHLDANGAVLEGGLVIDTITLPDVLTFTTTPSNTPTAGHEFVPSDYTASTTDQTDEWAYRSDASGEMPDGSSGPQYEG